LGALHLRDDRGGLNSKDVQKDRVTGNPCESQNGNKRETRGVALTKNDC